MHFERNLLNDGLNDSVVAATKAFDVIYGVMHKAMTDGQHTPGQWKGQGLNTQLEHANTHIQTFNTHIQTFTRLSLVNKQERIQAVEELDHAITRLTLARIFLDQLPEPPMSVLEESAMRLRALATGWTGLSPQEMQAQLRLMADKLWPPSAS